MVENTHASRPPRLFNQLVDEVLRSPLRSLLDPGICELRFSGRRSGRPIKLPVMYVEHGGSIFVVAGDAPDKQWWRNFREPRAVGVLHHGKVLNAICHVVDPGDAAWAGAWQAYTERHRVARETRDQLLRIDPVEACTS